MDGSNIQYHIGLGVDDCAPYCICPGDPFRVPLIASYLENVQEVAHRREYRTSRGTYQGVPVSITSTGIGGPSAAICFEELARVGAKVIIRLGTCGGLQDGVKISDLVVANAAIRDEGTTRQYVPLAFPAVADLDVTLALRQAAQQANLSHHTGIVHCKDAFYGEEEGTMPLEDDWKARWKSWKRAHTLCTEMEGSTLFVVGQIRQIKTGMILTVIGETKDGEVIIKKVGVEDSIKVALDAIKRLEDQFGYASQKENSKK